MKRLIQWIARTISEAKHIKRTTIFLVMGAGGFIQLMLTTTPDPHFPEKLVACMALMGVPTFLHKDEERRKKEDDE